MSEEWGEFPRWTDQAPKRAAESPCRSDEIEDQIDHLVGGHRLGFRQGFASLTLSPPQLGQIPLQFGGEIVSECVMYEAIASFVERSRVLDGIKRERLSPVAESIAQLSVLGTFRNQNLELLRGVKGTSRLVPPASLTCR